MSLIYLFLLVVLIYTTPCSSFYFSQAGTEQFYPRGDSIQTKANKLTSMRTAVPFEFYKLPFCKPSVVKTFSKSLGEYLDGDNFKTSTYEIQASTEAKCLSLNALHSDWCKDVYSQAEREQFIEFIKTEYRAQMLLDGLPVAEKKQFSDTTGTKETIYEMGFPVGYKIENTYYINNHLKFIVNYHTESSFGGKIQVVGFEVQPESEQHQPQKMEATDKSEIFWTYSVVWAESSVQWSSRWAAYFPSSSAELHWVTVTYSLVVALGLSGLIAVILLRILRTQNAVGRSYGHLEDTSYVEDSGWKVLHGDVFRSPARFMLFSVLVGAGAQVLITATFVILLGAFGFLSPAISGSRTTAMVTIYVLMGIVGGFVSSKVYIMLRGTRKRRNAVMSAFGFPGVCYIVWFIADIALWSEHSSAGPSFGIMCALFAMWFGIMVPLSFLGSFLAHKRYDSVGGDKYPFPVLTNQIPRMVPSVLWYMDPVVLMFVLAVLPFGTIFNELFFILSAMWSHHIFYLFGVVLGVFALFVLITAEVAVVLCYFQLSNENYHWWWRSVMFPGVTVSYIMVYALFYFGFSLELAWASSVVVFLGYTLIIGLVLFALMAFVAYVSCMLFVYKIYQTIHVD